MLKAAIKTTLYQDVLRQITDAIHGGAWNPGQRLPGENELASKLGVSRNCVREALKALELSGILESKQGKGTRITPDALRRIENSELLKLINGECSLPELMEVRLIIEPQAAYWAAERASTASKKQLVEFLDRLKADVLAQKDWVEIGFEFHVAIAEMANNRLLARLIHSLANELKAQRNIVYHKNPGDEKMVKEHAAICEAIVAGLPKAAFDAMAYHLVQAFTIIIEAQESPANLESTSKKVGW
jgi:GntR family transcriptional regulator, transcriptional repressor for pyruvate dehydrogenase complex